MLSRKLGLLVRGYLTNSRESWVLDWIWCLARITRSMWRPFLNFEILAVRDDPKGLASASIEIFQSGERAREPIQIFGEKKLGSELIGQSDLQAHLIRDAAVSLNRSYSSVKVGQNFLIPTREEKGPWRLHINSTDSPGLVVGQRSNLIAIRHRIEPNVLPSGIYVGTRSPRNWSHWLINFLPSVYLLRYLPGEYGTFPLLIPSDLPEDPHWIESLSIILEGRETIELYREKYQSVRRLIYVDSPFYDTPFSKNQSWHKGLSFHREAMAEFREQMIARARPSMSDRNLPKRAFIVRQNSSGRVFNQRETIEVAGKFGFQPVKLETLTFGDKIRLFTEAEFLIGAEGSGFANVIFANRSAKLLTWWHQPLDSHANYNFNLASLSGATYRILPLNQINSNPSRGVYEVKLDFLELALARLVTSLD